MKKVIILKGLPASGKSTYAKELLQENPGAYKRINKDDLRNMLDGDYHSKGNEKFVLQTRDWLITHALQQGKHVIVDDTNLHPRHETRIRELVKTFIKETEQQVKVEVRFFEISVEEAIRRDLGRARSVGEKVIRRMYKAHLSETGSKRHPSYLAQDTTLPKALICDLDGTLAFLNGRNPFEAFDCLKDTLNQPVADMVKRHQAMGYKVLLLSGRKDTYKADTIEWLQQHDITYDLLLMRPAKDLRKDALLKREFYEEYIQGKYYVDFVLDDRNQVVDMWRKELGLACLQVYYGDF